MADTRIETVEPGDRKALLRFIRQPRRLYGAGSRWVSPLDRERVRFFDPARNPFFRFASTRLFLARDGAGRDVGRIAAIVNPRHNGYQRQKLGFWGFFDCIDDREAAAALLAAAEGWLREQGFAEFQGPYNPSSNHECGLLVTGFDRPPRILMTYNHPYYAGLVEAAGYEGAMDLVAYEYQVDGTVPARLLHGLEVLKHRSRFTIRRADLRRFDEELARVKVVYNEAWSENFGFVPFTDAEIDWMASELKPLITPDMCLFAEVDGEVAGVALSLPDVNQALRPLRGRLFPFGWWKLLRGLGKVDAMRAILMGIRQPYRKMGIDYAFYHEGLQMAFRHKYTWIELSWVLAHNTGILRPLERFGAKETKRYRLYGKRDA